MNTDDYNDMVLNNQNQLESFEVEHLTSSIMNNRQLSMPVKRQMVSKINAISSTSNQNVHTKIGNDARYHGGDMSGATGSVAEFSLIIIRNSSHIPRALPVVEFMSDFVSNNYQQILPNFLNGVTLVSVVTQFDRLRFTFSNGIATDTVDILCDTTAYPSFIASQNTTFFKTTALRMTLNVSTVANQDLDAQRQFGVVITPYRDTNFGEFGGNRYPLTNCQPPNQFLKNVIDIAFARFPLSPRQGIVIPIINATAIDDVVTMKLGHWVQEFSRTSAG